MKNCGTTTSLMYGGLLLYFQLPQMGHRKKKKIDEGLVPSSAEQSPQFFLISQESMRARSYRVQHLISYLTSQSPSTTTLSSMTNAKYRANRYVKKKGTAQRLKEKMISSHHTFA